MKKTNITKLLSLSLAALICFTGCKKPSSSQNPSSSETPVSSQAPTSSEAPTSSQAPTTSETPSTSEWGTLQNPLTVAQVACCKKYFLRLYL